MTGAVLPREGSPSGPPVLVAGLSGAEPESIASALISARLGGIVVGEGRTPPAESRAAVLAVDLTIDSGSAEEALLIALCATGSPVALVGVGAGADTDWPRRLAAARRRLDPAGRLPVFAVSTELLRAGDEAGSGLPALVRWCADPGTAAAPDPVPRPTPSGESAGRDGGAVDPARGRAERLAGARAGLADLRGRLAVDLRAGAGQLTHRIQSASGGGVAGWLTGALTIYADRIDAELTAGLDQIRAAALAGLRGPVVTAGPAGPADRRGATSPSPAGRIVPPAIPVIEPEARVGRLAAEDLVLLVVGASAGFGVGRVAVGPLVQWAGFGAAATALTVLAGLAVAAGVVGVRRQAAARAVLRAAAVEAVGGMRGALEHAVAARLGAAEAQLARELWNRTGVPCVQPSREKE